MGASGNTNYTSFKDMFDGGGAGQTGAEFEGGLLSGLLNELGVKPYGYEDRMKSPRPQLRPQTPMQRPTAQMRGSGMTPANNYVPSAAAPKVTTEPLIGPYTTDDLRSAIDSGPGMTMGQPLQANQAITPEMLRSTAMQMFPGMSESQAQQRMYAYLMKMGGM